MIDWATVIVYCPHNRKDLDAGVFLRTARDGQVESVRERAMQIRGSYAASTLVQSHIPENPVSGPLGIARSPDSDQRHYIRIDGNPSKWRWGHNCWGTDDPAVIDHWMLDVLTHLGLYGRRSQARLTRIDVTKSYRLDSQDDVDTWLRTAERNVTMRYRGRGNLVKGGTLYWGKNSRRSSLKAYSKNRELTDRPLHTDLPNRDLIIDWTSGILRIETCYRSMALKENYTDKLNEFDTDLILKLYNDQLNKLNLPIQTMTTENLHTIPRSCLSSYHLWKSGADLISILPRSSFYRHRKILLRFGVDIASVCDDIDPTVDVRVLNARPATPPSWAFDSHFSLAA